MARLLNGLILSALLLSYGSSYVWAQSELQTIDITKIQPQTFDLVLGPMDRLPDQINPIAQEDITLTGEIYQLKLLPGTSIDAPNLLVPAVTDYLDEAETVIQYVNIKEIPTLQNPGRFENEQLGGLEQAETEQIEKIRNQLNSLDLQNLNLDSLNIDQMVEPHLARIEPLKKLPPQPSSGIPETLSGQNLPMVEAIDMGEFKDKGQLFEQATDYFKGHEDKLQEAQSLMSKLKKKYRSIANSNDLSTAIKRHSLRELPFSQRITPGLNFQLLHGNPMSVDLAPNLMYRLNARFSMGLAGNFRASLGFDTKASNPIAQHVYGGSILAKHTLFRDFFLYSEAVWLSSESEVSASEDVVRSWHPGWLVGIGKRIHFSERVKGQVIFTYDLLYQDDSPAPRAWNIKFGIQTERLFQGSKKLNDLSK